MFDQNASSPFTTIVTTPAQTTAQKPLRESVKQAVHKYRNLIRYGVKRSGSTTT